MDDLITLTFYKGKNETPVAKNKQGKICLLDTAYCKKNNKYVHFDEEWRCVIAEDKPRFIIVQPINRIKTAEQTMEHMKNLLKLKFNGS